MVNFIGLDSRTVGMLHARLLSVLLKCWTYAPLMCWPYAILKCCTLIHQHQFALSDEVCSLETCFSSLQIRKLVGFFDRGQL